MTEAADVERVKQKNRTTYRMLDRIAQDKRVDHIYEDSDGIWVELAPGYNFEGCSSVRGDTVRDVLEDFAMVEEGAPY